MITFFNLRWRSLPEVIESVNHKVHRRAGHDSITLAVVYIAPLRSFFGTHPLSLFELGVCFGCSLLIFVWIEGEKLFVRRFLSKS
jgi:Cation transporting ATPase, C-terminus